MSAFIYCGSKIPFTPAAVTADQLELQVNRSRISIAMCRLTDTKLCIFFKERQRREIFHFPKTSRLQLKIK